MREEGEVWYSLLQLRHDFGVGELCFRWRSYRPRFLHTSHTSPPPPNSTHIKTLTQRRNDAFRRPTQNPLSSFRPKSLGLAVLLLYSRIENSSPKIDFIYPQLPEGIYLQLPGSETRWLTQEKENQSSIAMSRRWSHGTAITSFAGPFLKRGQAG